MATNGSADNGANDFSYPEMATPYRVLQQYHSKPTKLRVACIGAGASGISLAYKMVSPRKSVECLPEMRRC